MADNQSNFFIRFFSCAKASFRGGDSPCKSGQKSFIGSFFDSNPRESPTCPKGCVPRENSGEESQSDSSRDASNNLSKNSPDKQRKPCYDSESEEQECCCDKEAKSILPDYACFIKEQNPLDPCCCELAGDDDDGCPCPLPGYPQNPRAPNCSCDRCRKSGYHGRCCGKQNYESRDPPRLEQA